ncbi:MAG: hypothetical protein QM784_14385 [Polyangiaceae bacterium]
MTWRTEGAAIHAEVRLSALQIAALFSQINEEIEAARHGSRP